MFMRNPIQNLRWFDGYRRKNKILTVPDDALLLYVMRENIYPRAHATFFFCVAGEIIGGSQREDDLEKLSVRAKEMGLPEESIAWYLDLRCGNQVF